MHIKEHYLTRARAHVHIWRQLEIIRYHSISRTRFHRSIRDSTLEEKEDGRKGQNILHRAVPLSDLNR